MDEPVTNEVTSLPERPQIKICPNCGATIFQGPFNRGTIAVDGTMAVREVMFQCMGCNQPWNLEQLGDH